MKHGPQSGKSKVALQATCLRCRLASRKLSSVIVALLDEETVPLICFADINRCAVPMIAANPSTHEEVWSVNSTGIRWWRATPTRVSPATPFVLLNAFSTVAPAML